ncbi:extracellular solute-binding protein [Candidatus Wolfebacteria bacterium]|nr:extracellular solute-binding protein [Candidatus Wolfebacteria bacterium]
MSFTRNQLVIIGAGVVVVAALAAVFVFGFGQQTQVPEVALTMAGTLDEALARNLIDGYRGIRPNVDITYTYFREEEYERRILDLLASGQAPDIVMIEDGWLSRYKNKIVPAAAAQFPLASVRQFFPQAVEQAFVADGFVYALPAAIDTLALFYNKDLFDAKTIAFPPRSWDDFGKIIPALREVDIGGRITRPAAAIGGSGKSIPHASDILSLLFLQSGEPKIEGGVARFDDPGVAALGYYVSFANPLAETYTWNDNLPNPFDNFANGTVAMIFGYAKDIPGLKSKNAFLNFGVAPAPQRNSSRPVSLPRFSGFAVAAQSRLPQWGWDFIVQATTNPALVEPVSASLGQSPALRTLVEKYSNDPDRGVFARQALTARLWPAPDADAARQIFSDAIAAVLSGRLSSNQALAQAAEKINSMR